VDTGAGAAALSEINQINPENWNNIPVPVVDFAKKIIFEVRSLINFKKHTTDQVNRNQSTVTNNHSMVLDDISRFKDFQDEWQKKFKEDLEE
jgi:ribose 5-phosphate isomerase